LEKIADMKKIKIIIADDHSILQHGLAKSLEMEKNFEIVAKADSGLAAIEFASQYLPDLVIMDVSMPGINGMEATKRILAKNPEIKVIALSMHMEKIYVTGMIKAGASGYILKSCSFKELLICIKMVLSGEYYFCKEVKHFVTDKDHVPVNTKKASIFSLLSEKRAAGVANDCRRP
jgi:DNA-binding NarL/FixJ family response regulator